MEGREGFSYSLFSILHLRSSTKTKRRFPWRETPSCVRPASVGLPVFGVHEPEPAVRFGIEVQHPVAVVPFQGDLPPAEWNLRIGIERADVRPGAGGILLRILDGRRVRVLGLGWPGVTRKIRLVSPLLTVEMKRTQYIQRVCL